MPGSNRISCTRPCCCCCSGISTAVIPSRAKSGRTELSVHPTYSTGSEFAASVDCCTAGRYYPSSAGLNSIKACRC